VSFFYIFPFFLFYTKKKEGKKKMVAAKDHPLEYFIASAAAAAINYPLWRASAIAQSGFSVTNANIIGMRVPASISPYVYAFVPPYKGMVGVISGMTWARAAIFWGSDYGKSVLQQTNQVDDFWATILPPLVVSVSFSLYYISIIIMRFVQFHLHLYSKEGGIS
jgi:hypothetical protein